jgi:hypothetical protein
MEKNRLTDTTYQTRQCSVLFVVDEEFFNLQRWQKNIVRKLYSQVLIHATLEKCRFQSSCEFFQQTEN